MIRWLLRPEAERDLKEIRAYTRRTCSGRQARAYISEIRTAIIRAARSPELGSPHPHPQHSYRRVRAGRHWIVYRVYGDGILIVRILHERMDIDAHLSG